MAILTYTQVSEILKYDPETGKLFWLPRNRDMFKTANAFGTWNTRYSGKEAFTAQNGNGYLFGQIFNRPHLAHRVCWLLHTGMWPKNFIDHKDGNRANNKADNLSDVTRSQNMKNAQRSVRNSSGTCGVYWNAHAGKWQAYIYADGKRTYLGIYDVKHDAIQARMDAQRNLGFSDRHGS